MTLDELIDLLGGDRAVARICNVGVSAVSNWRSRGVPAHRAIQLARAARRSGLVVAIEELPRTSAGRQGRAG